MTSNYRQPSLGLATSRRALLLGLGACAVHEPLRNVSIPFVDLPAEAQQANADSVKAFLGSCKHVGGAKERAALAKAIDELVSQMSVFAREIARGRLTDGTLIPASIAFRSDAQSLTVSLGDRRYTGPLDGRTVKVKVISGDPMDMHYGIATNEIRQVFAGDDRGSMNTFRCSGQQVVQRVRIYASQLPAELVYTLTYERV